MTDVPLEGEVRIPWDDDVRTWLATLAGLSAEERRALDQWCYDEETKRARGVLLNDAENHR